MDSGHSKKVPTARMMSLDSESAWNCWKEDSEGSISFFQVQRCLQQILLRTEEMVIA